MNKCCLIVDGFSVIYRAFFGMPTRIRTIDGMAINAALGFYNTLYSLIKNLQPTYLVVASDLPHATFRHHMYAKYKANRPPMPEELRPQLALIRDILDACQIPVLEHAGFEADDIIGTIANLIPADTEAYIVTSDRDALQLVNDSVRVLVPQGKRHTIYSPTTVEQEWHVAPSLIPDIKALMGDSSDNIPGVPRVGPKTAAKWLRQYGSLEGILKNADELAGQAGHNLRTHGEQAILFKELATIRIDVPLVWCWQSFALTADFSPLRDTLEAIGIRAPLPSRSPTGA